MTIFFIGTTIICALGWVVCWTSTAALVKYMHDKGYTPPSSEETKECCTQVWEWLLRR